ncbi:hypothetical protein OIU79_027768 [Salix purpurea]|uniref:EF-hand domain-containing protein n=1 Tax=Salix purpurea TaxID=77065 RepID=A0A9Q0VV01_SALPP|nr:hypothetical protein OIU79_027768 [Salix purpurea]
MEAADVDGDGALNYGEFVAISVHIKKMGNDEHLHKAFAFFDRNQSGYIEIEELRESLNDDIDTSSEDVINAIMHDVDTDKDGRISYEEFATMMKAGTDWRKASRQYSRERFNNLSITLRQDGSLQDLLDIGRIRVLVLLSLICSEFVSHGIVAGEEAYSIKISLSYEICEHPKHTSIYLQHV